MPRANWAFAALCGAACAANGQSHITPAAVHYTLAYSEVDATTGALVNNPDRQLSPGEGLLLRLDVEIWPGIGAIVSIPFSIHPTSGSGTIAGFWSGAMDLRVAGGLASGAGSWSGTGSEVPLALRRRLTAPFNSAGVGGAGIAASGGAVLQNLMPGQFAGNIENVASTNPIAPVWRGVWVPESYTDRSVPFELVLATNGVPPAFIAVRDFNGVELPIVGTVVHTFTGVTVAVVPSPAATPILLCVGALAPRRRNRSSSG
jgi:hypothetical protein